MLQKRFPGFKGKVASVLGLKGPFKVLQKGLRERAFLVYDRETACAKARIFFAHAWNFLFLKKKEEEEEEEEGEGQEGEGEEGEVKEKKRQNCLDKNCALSAILTYDKYAIFAF